MFRIIERKRLQIIDASAKAESIVPVKIIEVQSRDVSKYIRSSGVIRAWQRAVILSEVTGKVKSISAKVGDHMEQDSVILKIDDELLRYIVEQAEAHVRQLEANREISNNKFERKKSLYKNKVISELEFDLEGAKGKADQALLDSAEASLKIARRDLRETLIKSPINGILAERSVDIGTNVTRGTLMATVVDIARVKINIGLSEKQISKVKEGQKVEVKTDAYPGKTYVGSVYSVGAKADDFTLSFPVEVVVFNNHNLILKPGMTARIAIKTGQYSAVFCLPQEAVVETKGQFFVWSPYNGQAHKVKVVPEGIVGSQAIIKNGLRPGQAVIVSGLERLYEGRVVQVIKE